MGEVNAYAVVFVIGGVIGTWAGFCWRLALKAVKIEENRAERDELLREIKELRAWKAEHI